MANAIRIRHNKEKNIMATLAEIRQKLASMESKPGGSSSTMDNAVYPFWNIAEGQSTTLRFLPDNDPDNILFWTERLMIRLPFPGIKGGDSRPVIVQVPCVEMYGGQCPVLQEVRPWFKDPSLEDMGRKYWKKKSYIFQGFVKEDALQEDTKPENPIRRFIIGPQIFNIIKGALLDPEMDNMPTDFDKGVDFRINKSSKGGYADYSTSKWSRRESALTPEQKQAIDTHGLFNLNDFLPKKPTEVEQKVMKEMFEASVDGQPYDPDRWSQYFRPAGMAQKTGDPVSATVAPQPAPAMEATAAPVAPQTAPEPAPAPAPEPVATATPEPAPTPAGNENKAEEILAMIRARQQK